MFCMQSALEASAQNNEVEHSCTEWENGLADLETLRGESGHSSGIPSGNFPLEPRTFFLPQLIEQAQQHQGSIRIAIKNSEIAEKNLRLLKANRAFEFSLDAQYAYNSVVKNAIAPAPAYNALSLSATIPLKFSNLNKGAILATQLNVKQSQQSCESIKLQLSAEVTKAYNTYLSEKKQLEQYQTGLIDTAEKILDSRIYSYHRGENGLTDVINAQHTYNNLRKDYLETIWNYVSALIELERAAGIWDLN